MKKISVIIIIVFFTVAVSAQEFDTYLCQKQRCGTVVPVDDKYCTNCGTKKKSTAEMISSSVNNAAFAKICEKQKRAQQEREKALEKISWNYKQERIARLEAEYNEALERTAQYWEKYFEINPYYKLTERDKKLLVSYFTDIGSPVFVDKSYYLDSMFSLMHHNK